MGCVELAAKLVGLTQGVAGDPGGIEFLGTHRPMMTLLGTLVRCRSQ